jgi:uncharacterized membrane protein
VPANRRPAKPQRRAGERPSTGAAAWVLASSLALCAIGLAVSVYLTVEHFTASNTLACPERGVVNCVKVTTSPQSYMFGVPVAVLGLAYFVVLTAACLPHAWRVKTPLAEYGRLGWAGLGVVVVLYLVYVELFELDAVCLWCTVVHVVTVAIFAVLAFGVATGDPDELR